MGAGAGSGDKYKYHTHLMQAASFSHQQSQTKDCILMVAAAIGAVLLMFCSARLASYLDAMSGRESKSSLSYAAMRIFVDATPAAVVPALVYICGIATVYFRLLRSLGSFLFSMILAALITLMLWYVAWYLCPLLIVFQPVRSPTQASMEFVVLNSCLSVAYCVKFWLIDFPFSKKQPMQNHAPRMD